MRVAGVDGTKNGWIAVLLDDGVFAGDRLLPVETRFDELGDNLDAMHEEALPSRGCSTTSPAWPTPSSPVCCSRRTPSTSVGLPAP